VKLRCDDQTNEVGYSFDPLPRVAFDLLVQGILEPYDLVVLTVMIRHRIRPKTHCWVAMDQFVRTLNRKGKYPERQVQRSLRRLAKAGLIFRVTVPKPDPEENRNNTGSRFELHFVAENGRQPRHQGGDTPVASGVTAESLNSRCNLNSESINARNYSARATCDSVNRTLLGGAQGGHSTKRSDRTRGRSRRRDAEMSAREVDQALKEEICIQREAGVLRATNYKGQEKDTPF
jgi:hypothetical protein